MFRNGFLTLSIAGSLLLGVSGCSNPLEDDDHDVAVGVDVTDMEGATLATYRISTGVWTYATSNALEIAAGSTRDVRIYFVAADGDRFQYPATGAEYTHRVIINDPAVLQYNGETNHGQFVGLTAGETTARVQLFHGSHADFETNPGMTVRVVADT